MRRHSYRLLLALGCCLLALTALPCRSAHAAGSGADPIAAGLAAYRSLQYEQALALLKSAAASGRSQAQYLLGSMYLNGVGVAPDPLQARTLLTAAAQQ